jgi:hypothetical protein
MTVMDNTFQIIDRFTEIRQRNPKYKDYKFKRGFAMFPIVILKSKEDEKYLAEKQYSTIFPVVYNSTMIPVDSLEGMAKEKNPKTMPTTEEADTWIEDDEVLYQYPGLEEPIRYPKDMYIKYFWLFYIVAVDFWEKYPEHVVTSQFVSHKEILENPKYLKNYKLFKKQFEKAVKEAEKNLKWAQEAREMVEEKKKEGTYWSELEQVAKECDKLEKSAEVG